MAIFSFRRVSRVVTGLLLVALLWSCHDKGVEPKQPKDYVFYFADPGLPTTLFAFHPTSLRIDSMTIPGDPVALTVSPDGQRIYLAERTKVIVVDTKALSQLAELPYFTGRKPVAVSPDNQFIALPGQNLTILRTSDYSVEFSDTDFTARSSFSADSKTLFCAAGGESGPGYVYTVNLADSSHPVMRRHFSNGLPIQVAPSQDQTKWFLYLELAANLYSFEVYNVSTDSIIFRHYLAPGWGEFAETPNGQFVFVTNPSNTGSDLPTPPLNFIIYDVPSNAISRVVYDSALFTGGGKYSCPPNVVRVTPDGRWLTIQGGSMSTYVLYLWDIQTGRFVYSKDWSGLPRPMTDLTVQTDL